jgi:hypothetical protein
VVARNAKGSRKRTTQGYRFEGEYPVLEGVLLGEIVVVIYDWMAFDREAPARNLFCHTKNGERIWRADGVGQAATDAYTGVASTEPLWVHNFSGFSCRIDERSGKVLRKKFTK